MPVGVSSTHEQLRAVTSQLMDAWHDFVLYLELPSASLYWNSCRTAGHDVRVAMGSLANLGYITFRPLWLIMWLLSTYLWRALQFLSKHLFHHAYVSAGKGWVQLRWATKALMKWQYSLSRTSVLMEMTVVTVLIGCFLLRRHIQRRKYVQRVTSWYRRKKRSVKESYRRGVRRIAETSQVLAMLMPHAVFLASVAAFKLLVPRLLTWWATDTYVTSVMTFWYPMIWTISLLQQHRNGSLTQGDEPKQSSVLKTKEQVHKTPRRSNIFPRTTPSRSVQRWLRAATTPVRRAAGKEDDAYNIHDEANYWLQYWVVYALFVAVCQLTCLLPIVGRVLTKYKLVSNTLRELQLVFFLWIFGVPMVTPELTQETRPLPLLYRRAGPVVTLVYNAVSNAIPETLWHKVVTKVQSVLDLAVLIKLMSTETKDWLVHVLEESRPLLPPAVTLLMPFFVTNYGVVYVKAFVPCAKCCKSSTLDARMSWLEYWVLHGLVSALLTWWAPLLWWVPFSTHAIFVLWCNLQIPKTTRKLYNVFEEELQAFGLLEKGDKDLHVERTVTAAVLRKLASSLPSGVEDEGEKDDNGAASESKNAATAATPMGQDDDIIEAVRKGAAPAATKSTKRRSVKRQDSYSDFSSDENEGSTANVKLRRSTRQRKRRTVN